jgi:hypothetical protein
MFVINLTNYLYIANFHRLLKTHLALYAFANSQVQNSLKYLYRARYLLLLVYGEDHPEMTLIDVSFSLRIININILITIN